MAAITATIKSDGVIMNPGFEILSIDTSKEFNKVPFAELKLIDGNVAKNEYRILDSDFFELGKKIDISLKYEGQATEEAIVFTGIVAHQGLELNRLGTTLIVELSDASVKMTSHRNNAVFTGKKDSDIIQKLVEQNNLNVGKIAATTLAHAQMIQYYATDWDFVVARAEANGQLVLANNGEISTIQPRVASTAKVLELGKDIIYDFDFQADGLNQVQHVAAVGWDSGKQALTRPTQGQDHALTQGNYNVPKIAATVGAAHQTLIHAASLHPDELTAWADAQVMKSRLSLLRGWIKVPGSTAYEVGQSLEFKGISQRFSGKNIISGIRHEVTAHDWVTHIQVGMDADWFSSHTKVVDSKAAGLLPGINGLQVGLVVAHEADPNNEFRVKVNIPAFNSPNGTLWARLAAADAGTGHGVFFRPEVGDEVVVGFLNDDPRQAIILGAMHSSAHPPPIAVTLQNRQKGIVTQQKYQLLFDEEAGTITLSTSAQNSICIDEKNKQLSLQDAHGNRVVLHKEGMAIDSKGDLKITVEKNLEIKAKGNIKIDGKKIDLI